MNTIEKTDEDYVLYADTDSMFVRFNHIAKRCNSEDIQEKVNFLDRFGNEKIQPYLSKVFDKLQKEMNFYEQSIHFKREKICDKAIFLPDKKKRYILSVWDKEGTRYHEPKLGVTGIEAVRSSTPMIVRNALKATFKLIMKENNETVMKYINEFKDKFMEADVEKIAFPSTANNLRVYGNNKTIYSKGTPIHVRGSLLFNHHLNTMKLTSYEKIKESEKIKFIYLKEPNPIHENVISFVDVLPIEFGLEKYIDRKLQFEKAFESPLSKIFTTIGWKLKETADLDDFLGL